MAQSTHTHDGQTAASLASAMVDAALPLVVDDFVQHQTAEWHDLIGLVQGDLAMERGLSDDAWAAIDAAFSASLSPAQAAQRNALSDHDFEQVILERQAAFELGRQYERTRCGGAR